MPAAPAQAAEVAFALRIENGRVPENMRLIRVKRNDVVKLEWTSDRPMTIHLHGYDIEKEIRPGTVTEMVFTARATGRFTVEPHLGQRAFRRPRARGRSCHDRGLPLAAAPQLVYGLGVSPTSPWHGGASARAR